MQITYDPDANAAYITLTDKTGELETLVINDDINIDVLPDGSLYGIELLDADRQLQSDDRTLTVLNQLTGEELRLKLQPA
ncbi:hypothetical protein DLJ53_03825 [Acuticoccus sediminis]|uniref:DUF2283 domain-containing protein n=1 Tax=Acuticoccus sediminis TaxID=2184697 RepID=A0A8B2NZL0_9HYPH|nr:DUF2283 domain-containing protein [Acuticoccus sediminis]RAI03625.1 hypothetical protein DLJ53_03825 [Acuticoccus sediminis]